MKTDLDINNFLTGSKSHILICFNVSTISELLVNASKPEQLLKFCLFIEEKEQKYSFVKLEQDCKFYFDSKNFNFNKLHQIILNFESKWKKLCDLPFPDICLIDEKTSSYNSKENSAGLIKISTQDLRDFRRLKFVLAHELGHYYYNNLKKQNEESKIKFYNYFLNNPFSWFSSAIIVSNVFLTFGLFPALSQSPLIAFLLLFSLVGAFGYGFALALDIFSYKERMINYTQEFFADHFARIFSEEPVGENDFDLIGGNQNYNLFTHPGGKFRLLNIIENQNNSIESWENIAVSKNKFLNSASTFEMIEYKSLLKNRIKRKFKEFLKKN